MKENMMLVLIDTIRYGNIRYIMYKHSRTRGSSENLEIQKMLLFFICCCFLNLRWNLWGSWDFQRFWTILPQAEESGLAVIITVGK